MPQTYLTSGLLWRRRGLSTTAPAAGIAAGPIGGLGARDTRSRALGGQEIDDRLEPERLGGIQRRAPVCVDEIQVRPKLDGKL